MEKKQLFRLMHCANWTERNIMTFIASIGGKHPTGLLGVNFEL